MRARAEHFQRVRAQVERFQSRKGTGIQYVRDYYIKSVSACGGWGRRCGFDFLKTRKDISETKRKKMIDSVKANM